MLRKTGLVFPLWLAACIALPATVAAQTPEEATATEAAATEEAATETAATETAATETAATETAATEEAAAAPATEVEPAPEPAPVEETAAVAPTTEAAAAEEEEAEEIVVTGTRIKRKSLATAAPVTVLSKEDLLASGMMSVGEILQRLPANANAINVQFNNGGNGTARVNLRSLDAVRTLVLVNGRRHVPGGDGADSTVDLNSIPVSIIERVEVLKDGASAIYGSDAIAGVVNIITRKDFVGVEANAYAGMTQQNDGYAYQVDATFGTSSERGNIVLSAMFFDQQPIYAGKREFSEVVRDTASFDWDAWDEAGRPSIDRYNEEFITPGGSIGTPQGTIIDFTGARGNAAWDASGCAGDVCYNDPDTGWRVYGGGPDAYNYQPENYLLTPNRRVNLYTQGNYELTERVTAFVEGSYTSRRSQQVLAPEPLYPFFYDVPISATNEYNPFGRDFLFVGRRMLEGGNRVFSQHSQTFRVVAGVEGELPDLGALEGWNWDAYVNFGRTEIVNTTVGSYNTNYLANALGPADDCTGDCVAFDTFSGAGTNVSQEMLDYINATGIDRGWTDQRVGSVNVGGPIFELVEGNPISLAVGYQYRREAGANIPNPLIASGDWTGNEYDPIVGRYSVNSGYFEVSLPILSDIPAVELLELNFAGRFVDYTTFGDNFSYKVGARWQVTDYLAARGTYSTAFRAPSIGELFSGVLDSFPNVSDPCSSVPDVGSLDNPVVAENCAADGLAGGIPDPQVQLRSQEGGNTELQPETASIITAGVVLEERLVPGLSAAIDYYNIEIEDAIQSIGSGIILSSCYENDPGERQFCELIQRDPNSGFIQNIIDTQNNVGGFRASGIDFDVRYSMPTEVGRFGASLEGTVLIDLIQVQASGYEHQYKGNYDQASGSAPGANPEFKLRAALLWTYEMFNAGLNVRYIPSFDECQTACNAERAEGSDPPITKPVDAYLAADIFAGVSVETFLGQSDLTLGMNNIADQEPPYIVNGFLAESDAATYDYMGRYFYLRFTQRF